MKSSVAGGAYHRVVGVALGEATHLAPEPPTEPIPSSLCVGTGGSLSSVCVAGNIQCLWICAMLVSSESG